MSIIIHPSIETSVFESRTIHVQLPPTHASHQGKSFNAILRGVSLVRGLNYYIPTCIPFVLSPRFGFLVRDSVSFLAECAAFAPPFYKNRAVASEAKTQPKAKCDRIHTMHTLPRNRNADDSLLIVIMGTSTIAGLLIILRRLRFILSRSWESLGIISIIFESS